MSLAAVTWSAGAAGAQQRAETPTFTWEAQVASGRLVRISNVNGAVTVTPSNGDRVEVTAYKRVRRGDPALVRIEAKKVGPGDQDVIICGLWGDATCDERGTHSRGNDRRLRDIDISVEFHVQVPRGVRVNAGTVNGDVKVDGTTAALTVGTVNGDVDITNTTAGVNASTVNGAVRASLARSDENTDLTLTTVNGSVVAELPGSSGADVTMTTVNGGLRTDFEMTLTGRLNPRQLRAHVGPPGGPTVRLTTVNGSIELRKR